MKKKIYKYVSVTVIAVAMVVSFQMSKADGASTFSLNQIISTALADGEGGYSCTASTSCGGGGSGNYVSCTGVIKCERFAFSVKCDGHKTKC